MSETKFYYPNDDVAYDTLDDALQYLADKHGEFHDWMHIDVHNALRFSTKNIVNNLGLSDMITDKLFDIWGEEYYFSQEDHLSKTITNERLTKAIDGVIHEFGELLYVGTLVESINVTEEMLKEYL